MYQAVKEESGERGWVPVGHLFLYRVSVLLMKTPKSWYIGKIAQTTPPGAPATPSTSGAPNHLNTASLSLDSDASNGSLQPQVSPMSSAFPPLQSRAAVA